MSTEYDAWRSSTNFQDDQFATRFLTSRKTGALGRSVLSTNIVAPKEIKTTKKKTYRTALLHRSSLKSYFNQNKKAAK